MARQFTRAEQIDILLVYGESLQNKRRAQTLYRERFPERNQPSEAYFPWLVQHLKTLPEDDNAEKFIISEEAEINVLACVNADSTISTRQIENDIGVNRESARRILKKHKFKPYKYQIHQHLGLNDFPRRLQYCQWFMEKHNINNNFSRMILFSDESRFTNLGMFNRNNVRYWARENEHRYREGAFQERFGVNVWLGVLGTQIVGPIFFNEPLTSQVYLNFLETTVEDFIDNLPLDESVNIYFQQDGAPAHNARICVNHLNNRFGNRWIGTNGPVRWAPRSPDLTPLDFFFWGHIKEKVYFTPPHNLDDLRNKIITAVNNITIPQKENVLRKIVEKCQRCIQAEGGIFEHLHYD